MSNSSPRQRQRLSRTPSRAHVKIHRYLSDQYCQCRISAAATIQMLHATSVDALALRHVNDTCLRNCRISFLTQSIRLGCIRRHLSKEGSSSTTTCTYTQPVLRSGSFAWKQVFKQSSRQPLKCQKGSWRAASYYPGYHGKWKRKEEEKRD